MASWACEGKTCSTNVANCCCGSPTPERDPNCRSVRAERKPCAGKCDCRLTVQSARAPLAAAAHQNANASPIVDFPAIVPPNLDLPTAPILTYAPVLPNPPPVWGAPPLHEGAPLRAPPIPFA